MDQIFKDNPKVDIYYKTSDGTPFFSKNAAQNHAKTLEQKNIETITRGSVKNSEENSLKVVVDTSKLDIKNIVNKVITDKGLLTNSDEVKNKVQEVVEKGAEGAKVLNDEQKLTPKQQLQADYEKKFGEVPAEEFTKAELSEAIEKGEKLAAKLNNEQ